MDYLDFYQDLLLEHTKEILPKIFSALENEKDPMTGVHFSRGIITPKVKTGPKNQRLPHLGINKNPGHHDPLGIYVFPRDYVLSGDIKSNAGFYNLNYWYIIRPIRNKCKILNLSKVTENELKTLLGKMGIPEEYLSDPGVYHKSGVEQHGHKLWGIMEKYKHDNKNTENFAWNKLFKKAGVNVLIDDGDGIIHSNEPNQLVYMEPGTYEVVDTGEKETGVPLFKDIIKEFPGYGLKKTIDRLDNRYILTLFHPEKRGIQIRLDYYKGSSRDLTVTIYGIDDYLKAKELKYTDYTGLYGSGYNHHLDPAKIAQDIKKYIEANIDKYKPDYYNDTNRRDAQIMKKISEHYKLSLSPRNFREISKEYSHRGYPVYFRLLAYDNKLEISIKRHKQYSSYNYHFIAGVDFTKYGEDVEAIMKAALLSLEAVVEERKPHSDDWAFEDNKKDVLKTIKFLRDRVFVARN